MFLQSLVEVCVRIFDPSEEMYICASLGNVCLSILFYDQRCDVGENIEHVYEIHLTAVFLERKIYLYNTTHSASKMYM